MAQKVSKTAFLNKIKNKGKGAFDRHKKDDIKVKGSALPTGLRNAVANFVGFTYDIDVKGNPYYRINAVCIEPKEYQGIKFGIQHRMVESSDPKTKKVYKTVDDKYAGLISDVKLLGVETDSLDGEEEMIDTMEKLAKKGKTFFKFNTWQPEGGQMNYFIQGTTDHERDEEAEDDEDVEEDEDEEEDEAPKKKPTKKAVKKKVVEEEEDDEEDEEEEEEEEEKPVVKKKSKKPVKEEPEEDEDDEEEEEPVVKKKSKTEVVKKKKAPEPEEDEDDDDGDSEPVKGEVYEYKGKPYEVTKVDSKKQTVDLKGTKGNPKTFKGVSWDDIASD